MTIKLTLVGPTGPDRLQRDVVRLAGEGLSADPRISRIPAPFPNKMGRTPA